MWWMALGMAAPSASALQAAWNDHVEHWVLPVPLEVSEFERLSEGRTVKRRDRLDGADRVIAVRWMPAARDDLWLAIQDEGHWDVIEDYVDEELPGSTFADRTLYQRIGLPWPFADRQWVIRVRSNRDLVAATGGRVWERSWALSDRRGASIEDPSAVWVEANEGAWVMVDVGGGTLMAYHTRASVNGNIPDEAATRWAMLTLSGMLDDAFERSRSMRAHYVDDHRRIERPDGSKIPVYGDASGSSAAVADAPED